MTESWTNALYVVDELKEAIRTCFYTVWKCFENGPIEYTYSQSSYFSFILADGRFWHTMQENNRSRLSKLGIKYLNDKTDACFVTGSRLIFSVWVEMTYILNSFIQILLYALIYLIMNAWKEWKVENIGSMTRTLFTVKVGLSCEKLNYVNAQFGVVNLDVLLTWFPFWVYCTGLVLVTNAK